MDNTIEKAFVQQFVVKEKRDRLLYELSGKKRRNGIGRFCHNAEDMLLQAKIIARGNHLYHDEIMRTAEEYGISGTWYIIAYDQNIDKKVCDLSEALELVLGNGMASVIVSGNMAIIETEQSIGTPMRYLLFSEG